MPDPKPRAWLFAAALALASWSHSPSLARASTTAHDTLAGLGGDSIGLSPFWNWKTLETEHFRLTFPEELSETAIKASDYSEEAYRLLTAKLKWKPEHKTQILLIDNSDSANGFTSAVGRVGIVLMVTPPDNWFSTEYYDDWLRLLIVHEYTHLVNMDTTEGFWGALRYVFGDTLLPNSAWNPWMLEGLAVYMETTLTRSGRGRSPYYEMFLRAAREEKLLGSEDWITIDRISDNPWFPGGETRYLFGYELMNEVARKSPQGPDALGIMSQRSGRRIPWFINGNLENITGHDWYWYWDQFIQDTRARMDEQLAKIRSQPLTPILKRYTSSQYGVLGSAASPDGKLLAYTRSSTRERTGLYVQDLATGQEKRLVDKSSGVGIAFTPDSRYLVYSALAKRRNYYLYSDLAAYDLESGRHYWLTEAQRARDPDVSPDGTRVVFTYASNQGTGLAWAPLERVGDRLRLGTRETLIEPVPYDRVSDPKFSPDGRRVVYSIHRNGHYSEELAEIDLDSRHTRTLVDNGNFNRFPAFGPEGDLYFVSDLTGVANLYRLAREPKQATPEQVSNVTTGVWMPSFGPKAPDGKAPVYVSLFTAHGWDLVGIQPIAAVKSSEVTIGPPPAPKPYQSEPSAKTARATYSATDPEIHDYSPWPSLLPREWAPILFSTRAGAYLGGQILGFDAVDRHRYLFLGAYDTAVRRPDFIALYSNRSLGPTLSLMGASRTSSSEYFGSSLIDFTRDYEASASLSFPFQWTYSTLTPSISAHAEREFLYFPSQSWDHAVDSTSLVPSFDGVLSYSDAGSSILSISPEWGRAIEGGARYYLNGDQSSWKALYSHTEFLRIAGHTVFVPQLKASWSSRLNGTYSDSNVIVRGPERTVFDPIYSDSFDELGIRGYSGRAFLGRAAVVPSAELRFPVLRFYHGMGTDPVFWKDLSGFAFAESAWFPGKEPGVATLPAAGAGLKLSSLFLNAIPLDFSLEYDYGFRKIRGSGGEVLFGINLGGISF